MVDSRVADLPRGWAASTLEFVAEVRDDLRKPVNAEERAGRVGPYPYYGATGQVGCIDDFLMDGEYVLLGEDGAPFLDPTRDKAYLVSGKCWVNNHAHVLRGIDGLCRNRFLLHALNHADYRGHANGTTRLKLTQAAMKRLPLRLAPPREQDRIVAKIEELFSDLDAGVAALVRVKANLKRYRASVLKAAVEGRLTEEWRKKNPATEHVKTLLKVNGRAAVVVPDNVLFEGGAGETVRRKLMQQFDVHTLLRLPTGIFYAQGVKANVLFFDARPAQEAGWTKKLWVYDLRTNMHFTQKEKPLKRADLDEFVECFGAPTVAGRQKRKATWAEKEGKAVGPEGRWRSFEYDDLIKRDKANLDIFWLRDKSLEDGDDLPEPDILAQEIADDLATALEQFRAIASELKN